MEGHPAVPVRPPCDRAVPVLAARPGLFLPVVHFGREGGALPLKDTHVIDAPRPCQEPRGSQADAKVTEEWAFLWWVTGEGGEAACLIPCPEARRVGCVGSGGCSWGKSGPALLQPLSPSPG